MDSLEPISPLFVVSLRVDLLPYVFVNIATRLHFSYKFWVQFGFFALIFSFLCAIMELHILVLLSLPCLVHCC